MKTRTTWASNFTRTKVLFANTAKVAAYQGRIVVNESAPVYAKGVEYLNEKVVAFSDWETKKLDSADYSPNLIDMDERVAAFEMKQSQKKFEAAQKAAAEKRAARGGAPRPVVHPEVVVDANYETV